MSTSSRNLADLQRSFAADGSFVVDPTTPYDPVPTHAAVNSTANAVNFLPLTPPSPSQSVVLPLSQMSLEARPPSPLVGDHSCHLMFGPTLTSFCSAFAPTQSPTQRPSLGVTRATSKSTTRPSPACSMSIPSPRLSRKAEVAATI